MTLEEHGMAKAGEAARRSASSSAQAGIIAEREPSTCQVPINQPAVNGCVFRPSAAFCAAQKPLTAGAAALVYHEGCAFHSMAPHQYR